MAVIVTVLGGLLIAVVAYWTGRADGWQQGVSDTHRAYREQTQRLNLQRNRELIDKFVNR